MSTPIKQLLAGRERQTLSSEGAISSGSALLNLACTDNPHLAFMKGGYYYLVGDSTSGKTWLSLSLFAEAALKKSFDNYEFIFDDVEGGALMNVTHYFGKAVARRMRPPAIDKKGNARNSDTIESFYYNIQDAIDAGKPFIYVLDSQDALDSDAASKKFEQKKKAQEEGDEVKGSYGDGKAKFHSENLRHVLAGLRKRKSILLIIGQTRDNLGMGFDPKTRSGGKALRFYANLEIWTSVVGKIKKMVHGKERTIGVKCLAEVKKNRVTGKTGKDRAVIIPIYHAHGIDDIGSCVDFLIEEGRWTKVGKQEGDEPAPNAPKRKKIYNAKDILFQGSREQIIGYIEEEELEGIVRTAAATIWKEIEDECQPHRKRRYE